LKGEVYHTFHIKSISVVISDMFQTFHPPGGPENMSPKSPLVPLGVGILLGTSAGLSGWPRPTPLPGLLVLAASPPLAPVAFAAAGWLAADAARAPPEVAPEGDVLVEGTIRTVPSPLGDRLRYQLAEAGGRKLELVTPPAEWPLAMGDQVRLLVRLRVAPGPRNPGATDQRERLAAVGVSLAGEGLLPPVRVAPPSPLAWLERGRQRFALATERLPRREAAVIRAIGTGDRGALDPATNESFVRSGLAHILAVSGLHLVVVAAGLERVLRWLLLRAGSLAQRFDPRRTAAALAIPATLLYAIATGAGFSVIRAAVAAAAVFAGTVLDREGTPANALGLAALTCLGAEPGALLDPSLQLSLASVAGLVWLASPLRDALPVARPPAGSWRARLLEPLLSGLCATVAASLATAPILAFQFRRLPALGLVANLAGIPIGTALTGTTALAAVVAAVSPWAAQPLLWLSWPLARGLLLVSDLAAAPRFAVIGIASPGPVLGLVACGLILVAPHLAPRGRWLAVAGFVACLALPGPVRAAAAASRGRLEWMVVSVGQGDASLLRLPDGAAVLVDGGGTFPGGPDPGARDLVPLLRDLGVTRLAAVVVSHPHPDHILGLASVAGAVEVGQLLTGESDLPEAARAALSTLPPPTRLRPGDAWERAGVRFEAVGGPAEELVENDASLVLRVAFGATAFLLPGDVEAAGEAAALAGGRTLAADVVKVPHHGSRTSSSAPFVAAVHPRWAAVSVGAGNRFGFPHPEALGRWTAAGATVARTDEGAIRFLSDGVTVRRVAAETVLHPVELWREGRGANP
jgi:competence protein ComEC